MIMPWSSNNRLNKNLLVYLKDQPEPLVCLSLGFFFKQKVKENFVDFSRILTKIVKVEGVI